MGQPPPIFCSVNGFEICVAPGWERAEEIDNDIKEVGEPILCLFCGADEPKASHDRATKMSPKA